jgi:hypothetical protein
MASNAILATDIETQAYRLERVELEHVSPSVLKEWNEFLIRTPSDSPMHDPQWLRDILNDERGDLLVYLLYRGQSLCGLAPFLLKSGTVKWQLGEITLARLPLQQMRLLGGGAHFPEETAAYELLFRELLGRSNRFDAIYLEDVPINSFLWKFAESNPVVACSFSRYVPEPLAPRMLLRLDGSFEEYMGRFSSKHRQTLRRKVRKFHDVAPGEVRSARFTNVEDVDSFVDRAIEISKKTYQWNLLGGGLRSLEKLKRRFAFLARQGWFRSYILFCKDTPCAFVVGYQYGQRFYLDDMGYDPGWKDYSVGTVLQLAIIEDLGTYNRPHTYDLGEYGPHKEEFATDNYPQGKLFLFRPGAYTDVVKAGHWACNAATRTASSFLELFGWKQKLKKLVRLWSSRS